MKYLGAFIMGILIGVFILKILVVYNNEANNGALIQYFEGERG